MSSRILAALALVVVACTKPAKRSAPAPPPDPAPLATAVPFVPSAARSAEPPPSALEPGFFSCGDASCRTGAEICCDYEMECRPRDDKDDGETCTARHECDVSADCPDGQACCVHAYAMASPYYSRKCEARPCREMETCRVGECNDAEECRGFDPLDPRSFGTCANAGTSVACGEQTCNGDRPWCDWDFENKTGSCVAALGLTSGVFRCDDDDDCLANERCWLGTAGSWCCRGDSCFDHAATTRYTACNTRDDCPELEGMRWECWSDENLPPAVSRRCFPQY